MAEQKERGYRYRGKGGDNKEKERGKEENRGNEKGRQWVAGQIGQDWKGRAIFICVASANIEIASPFPPIPVHGFRGQEGLKTRKTSRKTEIALGNDAL